MKKEQIKKMVPKPIYKIGKYGYYALQFLVNKRFRTDRCIKYKYRERRVSYGDENSDKTFYVIRNIRPEGMFSWYMLILGHLEYAKKKNYIPIIDQKSLENPLFDKSLLGKDNVWEYFFEQPAGYTLEDIAKSKNVVLSNAMGVPDKTLAFPWKTYEYKEDNKKWSDVAAKNLHLNKKMQEYVNAEYEKYFKTKERGRVLGIAVRRSDKVSMTQGDAVASGMMIEAELSEQIDLLDSYLSTGKYDSVFVTADDEEAIEVMQKRFGEKCFFVERKRFCIFKDGKVAVKSADEATQSGDTPYMRNYKYIAEIVLLSRCQALIGGRNGGAIVASLMSHGGYDFFDIQGRGWYSTEGTYYEMVDGMARLTC